MTATRGTAYGLTQPQVDESQAVCLEYDSAYQAGRNVATRGPRATREKDDKMWVVKASTRRLVRVIQGKPGSTDVQRVELRSDVKEEPPAPIGPPAEVPQLSVTTVRGRVIELLIRRSDGRRSKPAWVRAAWFV